MTSRTSRIARWVGRVLVSVVTIGTTGEAAPPGAAPSAAASAEHSTVRGVITTIANGRLSLRVDDAVPPGTLDLRVDGSTVVMKGRQKLDVGALRAGDPVTVMYGQVDGRPVAKRIWVRGVTEAPRRPAAALQ